MKKEKRDVEFGCMIETIIIFYIYQTFLMLDNSFWYLYFFRLQKVFQNNSESYNGAMRDNYSWSQSITDADVRVKVCNIYHVFKEKELSCKQFGRKKMLGCQ